MPDISIVGQHAMDAFLQQYRGNADFWDIDDFIQFSGMAFGKIMKEAYKALKDEMRADREDGYVEFSTDWNVEVTIDVKSDAKGPFADLPNKFMSFPFDIWSTGIQHVYPDQNSGCGEFLKTSLSSVWELCYVVGASTTFFWGEFGQRIRFKSGNDCVPKKIQVLYIPSSDNEQYEVPDTLEMDVIGLCLNLMIESKNQRPVLKRVNDGNFNAVLQEESNFKKTE